VPVVRRLAASLDVPISIDTFKAEVAAAALDAGADLVNSVWGLAADPELGPLVAERGVPLVLMHNQKGTEYHDLMGEVTGWLQRELERAVEHGIAWEQLIVDPGIGFGKTKEHNLEIMARLDGLRSLGRPILFGSSRKSTIGYVLDAPADDRLEGTAATNALAIARGADVIRVHDVRALARVAKMTDAIVRRGWWPTSS
ncbi:MAG: dihydropteroate synthase, partial [Chloroflexi bacterium]|nr:dihydropteroate synthase [Chloroflexota bacterium]